MAWGSYAEQLQVRDMSWQQRDQQTATAAYFMMLLSLVVQQQAR